MSTPLLCPASSTYRERPKKAGGGAYRNFDNVYITRILNFNRKPRIRSHNKTINGYQLPVYYIFVLGNTTVSNFQPQLTIIYIWSITITKQVFMIFFLNTFCGEFMKSCLIYTFYWVILNAHSSWTLFLALHILPTEGILIKNHENLFSNSYRPNKNYIQLAPGQYTR